MKRALLFLLIFIGVIVGTFLLVIGPNYTAWKTLRENQAGMSEGVEFVENTYSLKGLTDFIGEHPEFVSISSFNVDNPDSGIFLGDEIERSMGTLGNLFLLIEYERQAALGEINRDEIINPEQIKVFALPQVSENAQQSFLRAMDENFNLDRMVASMIKFNSLAAADYLWFKLGEENIIKLIRDLELPEAATPVPFSGMYINLNAGLRDSSNSESFSDFKLKAVQNARKLIEDDTFRSEVFEHFKDGRLFITFMEERDALSHFPKITTGQLSRLMAKLVKGEVISKEVSANVLEKLRWPMAADPLVQESFDDYGAIYDDRMGLLAGVDFGTSAYDGHTSVQTVVFDQLPVAFWMHMSSTHMQKDFQQRLIWDPALFETTANAIQSANE